MILVSGLALGCSGKPSSSQQVEKGFVTIASNGEATAVIRVQQKMVSSAAAFVKDIEKVVGVRPEVISSVSDKNKGQEVVIGHFSTYSDQTHAAIKEIRHGFVIKAEEGKIMIVGTDDAWTVLGLEYFGAKVLTDPAYCSEGTLKIPDNYKYVQDEEDPQLIARLLSQGRKFDLVPVQVGSCPREGSLTVAQGAASDGEYVYFTMKGNEDSSTHNSEVAVYQYKLSPFTRVGVSETFNGHHANDMTFDTKGRRVLVVHGSGASNTLTAIPAGPSMGAPVSIKTSLGIGGLTYNAKRDIYGITQGGSKYQTADASFKMIKDYGRTDNMKDTYTAQGMGSDDSYVYFPMSPNSNSPEKVNILVAYDWDGKYIRNLKIPLTLESESMFYAAGEYYVNFYNKAAVLYRVYPNLTYQSQVK